MPWDLTGNGGTSPSVNFLGTTDNHPLVIQPKDGNVGIGTVAPNSKLHVSTPGSSNPISALTIDVQTFGTPENSRTSHFLRVRDIGGGSTPFFIRGDGNVGIGTNNPDSKLEIKDGDLVFKASADDAGDIVFQNSTGVQKARIWSQPIPGAGLFFSLGDNNPNISVLQSGNVGIGTVEASSKLHVSTPGSSNPISALTVDVQTFGTPENSRASHFLRVRDIGGGSTPFFIRGDGNVGIGTETPSRKLSVNGDIEVTGDIILTNADCAEDFDISELEVVEPGTVMVIDSEGYLSKSNQPYDKRVAGVISGAGDYKPGIILGKQETSKKRMPIALVGKVYCKVDANYAPIEVGDLLTTSLTAGHAMKASEPLKAFGTVIGKALRPLGKGLGLIPILIALQ